MRARELYAPGEPSGNETAVALGFEFHGRRELADDYFFFFSLVTILELASE
jgi:hypothetical protein